jgi:16S rRNA processing protein RimM
MDSCLIGSIVAAHGIAGGLKVRSHSDIPGRFAKLKRVYVGRDAATAREYTVRKASDATGSVLLFLDTVTDRNTAETLIGSSLYIEEKDMLPPPEGRHYVHDLIGCEVRTEDGTRKGVIRDVLLFPANDLYSVDCDGREVLIPAVPEIVVKVDTAARLVTVADLPGLFTLEDDDED